MTISSTHTMALKSFQELISESGMPKGRIAQGPAPMVLPLNMPGSSPQTLLDIISKNSSFPLDALVLGIAEDGLPILLNLSASDSCPLLVVGEAGSGKTQLLKAMANAVDLSQETSDIQFGVVTGHPDEWQLVDTLPGNMGIWPVNHVSSQQFIQRMVDWARQPEHGHQMKILFLDDLSSVLKSSIDIQENVKWLLVNGGKNHVWTVASLNVLKAVRLRTWLDLFNTQIFGYIQRPSLAQAITAGSPFDFESLVPGLEFEIKQQDGWLRFCLPALDIT